MEDIQEQHNLYRVKVEREVLETREMVVYATSEEEAEGYAREAAFGGDVPNVLRDDDEWDDEDANYGAYANEVSDWDAEFPEEADDFRNMIVERFKKPEPVDLDKLQAAGWKVDLRGSGLLRGKKYHVFAIEEGETIGYHGFGDTMGAAVRDAAQNNQKLHDALAV